MAQGITVFRSIAEAMLQGYHIWDRTEYGYLVRARTAEGYAFAMVVLHPDERSAPKLPAATR